jgi:uncharacterized protein with PIN domain
MPSFLVDAMLGSIARKLRILGFDTLYMKHTSDNVILETAVVEDRIILTCDKDFFKRIVKVGAKGVLLEDYDDMENIVYALSKYGVTSLCFDAARSRCSVCNGSLLKKKRVDVKGTISIDIIKRYNEFFQCVNCNKIYWEGSHVSRIQLLAQKIENIIKKEPCNNNTAS